MIVGTGVSLPVLVGAGFGTKLLTLEDDEGSLPLVVEDRPAPFAGLGTLAAFVAGAVFADFVFRPPDAFAGVTAKLVGPGAGRRHRLCFSALCASNCNWQFVGPFPPEQYITSNDRPSS
jgi:hypothetical protein